jgi:hypothetical protein
MSVREAARSMGYAALAVWGVMNVVLRWLVMPRARFARWVERMEGE